MKKMIKKINVALACCASVAACLGLALWNGANANAKAEEVEGFEISGASVRYANPGIRVELSVSDSLFADWTENGAFKSGVTVGGLVLPADLTDETELKLDTKTHTNLETNEAYSIYHDTLAFEDFTQGTNLNAGNMIAYITLYNFTQADYNREYLVSAYYQTEAAGEKVYAQTKTWSFAQVATDTIATLDKNDYEEAQKIEMLEGYILSYPVNFYKDGVLAEEETLSVKWNENIDQADVPVWSNDETIVEWYADEACETPFDFTKAVKGTTNVYAKTKTMAQVTDGLFKSLSSDYVIGEDDSGNVTLSHTLQNSSAKKGVATLNVDANEDYYVSMDLKLTSRIKVSSQGWAAANDRLGFAFINQTTNTAYRFLMRTTYCAVIDYNENENWYADDNQNKRLFLYGSTNGLKRPSSEGDADIPASEAFVLKQISSINDNLEVSIAFAKVGNLLTVYVNGAMWATRVVDEAFNGVPALLGYTYETTQAKAQSVTYSNIVLKKGAEAKAIAQFTKMDSDMILKSDGTVEQVLRNNSEKVGLAHFNVDPTGDYSISTKIWVSVASTADNNTNSNLNSRIGLTFYNADGTSYIYQYRIGSAVILRNINSQADLYKDQSSASTRKYWWRDRANENNLSVGCQEFTMTIVKKGTTIKFYLNDNLLETVEDVTVNYVPSIFSFTDYSTGSVTVKYSNIVIKTGSDVQ